MQFGALHAQGVAAAVGRQDWSSVRAIFRLAAIVVLGADETDVEAVVAHDYARLCVFPRHGREVVREMYY